MKKILIIFILIFSILSTTAFADATIKNILGGGDTITDPFHLPEGSLIFSMQSSGEGNFIAWLLDENREKIELLANEIGLFSGSRGIGIPKTGDYSLAVKASNLWSVKILKPNKAENEKFSLISGSGAKGTHLYHIDSGLKSFKTEYLGEGNFIVWLLNEKGRKIAILANEIGTFSGVKETNIPSSGFYLFDIQAEGKWEIS
jgi:hypothetical protein